MHHSSDLIQYLLMGQSLVGLLVMYDHHSFQNHPSVLEGRTCTLVVVQCTQEAGHKVDTGAGAAAQITIEVEDIAQVVDTARVKEDTAVVEEDTTVIKEDDVDVDINVDMDMAGVPHTSLLQWYVNISNFICKTYILYSLG